MAAQGQERGANEQGGGLQLPAAGTRSQNPRTPASAPGLLSSGASEQRGGQQSSRTRGSQPLLQTHPKLSSKRSLPNTHPFPSTVCTTHLPPTSVEIRYINPNTHDPSTHSAEEHRTAARRDGSHGSTTCLAPGFQGHHCPPTAGSTPAPTLPQHPKGRLTPSPPQPGPALQSWPPLGLLRRHGSQGALGMQWRQAVSTGTTKVDVTRKAENDSK